MKPVYHWVDHTGELELEIQAQSEAGVFEDALAALAELLAEEATEGDFAHQLEVEGNDRATLLAEYLMELLFLAETQGFVPARLERLELDGERLNATVRGGQGRTSHLVKAVTYHGLSFEQVGEGWRARVVLDV